MEERVAPDHCGMSHPHTHEHTHTYTHKVQLLMQTLVFQFSVKTGTECLFVFLMAVFTGFTKTHDIVFLVKVFKCCQGAT